jgi:hypothetical protein
MGTLYKITCKRCEEIAEVAWGDGMFYLQFQCDSCLKLFHIPRKAPRQNRNGREVPKFLETQSFKTIPPTPIDEITRFTDEELKKYVENRVQWQKGDDEWDEFEIKQLISIASCKCDALFARVSKIKQMNVSCQKCGSKNHEKEVVGTVD